MSETGGKTPVFAIKNCFKKCNEILMNKGEKLIGIYI